MCAAPAALASRVAKERGEAVGKVVGYSIHADRSSSSLTRLLFCTTGILIRRLMIDPELASVTHVIIDEVHERGLEVSWCVIGCLSCLYAAAAGWACMLFGAQAEA